MQGRIKNPVMVVPGALDALRSLSEAALAVGVPETTHHLIHLRASQINGCGVCVDMHAKDMRKAGEPIEKIFAVGAWRESPHFSAAERAALALAECVTRLADKPDPVPDDVWEEAAKHYDEAELASLVLSLAGINAWNRINASVHQPVGQF